MKRIVQRIIDDALDVESNEVMYNEKNENERIELKREKKEPRKW
jgi:hypothetical protein